MEITKRTINKLEKKVNKKIKNFYKDGYFYINSATICFNEGEGLGSIVCVAGYKTGETTDGRDEFRQVNFTFNTMSEVVKSIPEHVAVLALYAINKLEDYSSFKE